MIGFSIKDMQRAEQDIKQNIGHLDIVQIFGSDVGSDRTITEMKHLLKKYNLKSVIHAQYTINIAREWTYYSYWIQTLINTINNAYKLGSIGIVLHLGLQLLLDKSVALNNSYSCLLYVLEKTKNTDIKIFIETSTGQGSEMCYNLEELSSFINKLLKVSDRIRICIDTCHIFAAGYDLNNKTELINYLNKFEQLIGIKYVALIHMNNAFYPLGSKKDRHQNLTNNSYINLDSLLYINSFFKKLNVPRILETPYSPDSLNKELELIK
jgi:deoxyribonuclease-4